MRAFASLALLAGLCVGSGNALGQNLKQAEELYKHTEYQASIALLDKHGNDAAANFLLGRDYLMLGESKNATEYLQRAAVADPKNGEYMDWLGRAFGRRAETSNVLSAPGLASKARQAFEKSVELNPKDSDALSDLFDYYLDAPGFLGGGYEKAQAVAQQIAAIDPSEGYFEKAKLAEKRKEFNTAELHIRHAIAATPQKVGGLLVLAKFLANQGRTRESDQLLVQAQSIQPNSPQIWYTRADLLIKQKRNLDEARLLLQKYLRAPVTVDDPSKEDAARLLRQVGGA